MANLTPTGPEFQPEQLSGLAREDRKSKGDLVGNLWNFFSSMKLGLILLLILAVASIAGTIIPQNAPEEMYKSYYGLYKALGLTDLYHTWWFTLLLFLLSMNLLICSLNRLKPILKATRQPQTRVSDSFLKQLKDRFTLTQKGEMDPLADKVTGALKDERFRVISQREGDQVYIYGDKGRLGLWGSFITHLSFLVIVVGAIIGNYFGYEGEMAAPVNETFSMNDVMWTRDAKMATLFGSEWDNKVNFSVKVNDFKTIVRKDGTVEDWFSDLSVIDNGQEVMRKTIEVNDPLVYKGVKIYQSFYGNTVNVKYGNGKSPEVTKNIAEGYYIQIPKTDYFVGNIYPYQGKIYYEIWKGEKQLKRDLADFNKPIIIGNNEGTVEFTGLSSFTGLSLRKDPGVWVVWIGCGLMVLGMFISFYMPHRRVWAMLTAKEGTISLELGGFAQKNKLGFRGEFARLVERLK